MSYSFQDRYGGLRTSYHPPSGTCGTGRTWWPDYGPTTREFSDQVKTHPTETIFEKQVLPFTRKYKDECGLNQTAPALPLSQQFRRPQPSREAINQEGPVLSTKLAAHEFTERQASLRRLELRQRRVDAFMGEPPVRTTAVERNGGGGSAASIMETVPERSRSETSISSMAASNVSRGVYEKHGFLVGRSKGSIADGKQGERTRKHKSLSFNALMMSGELLNGPRKRSLTGKPSKQWNVTPQSSYVFDPSSFLPVPRGGYNAQHPSEWPDAVKSGRREFAKPVQFGDTASLAEAIDD